MIVFILGWVKNVIGKAVPKIDYDQNSAYSTVRDILL